MDNNDNNDTKDLLEALYEEGIIPTYSFPKNVVSTYISNSYGKVQYQVERGLDIAISEYANTGTIFVGSDDLAPSMALPSPGNVLPVITSAIISILKHNENALAIATVIYGNANGNLILIFSKTIEAPSLLAASNNSFGVLFIPPSTPSYMIGKLIITTRYIGALAKPAKTINR